MRIVAQNLWTWLETTSPPLHLLRDIVGYKVDGYWFSPAYKRGHWDGYTSFLKKTPRQPWHYFPTGFLGRVVEALDKANWKYTLDDLRHYDHIDPVFELLDGNRTIRIDQGKFDYQAAALQTFLSHGRGIVKIATGGGKTELGAAVIKSLNFPSVWFTHRTKLLYQTANRLQKRLGEEIGIIGDGQRIIKRITVAMVQSAQTWAAPEFMEYLNTVQLIIGDEVHHLKAEQWYENFCKIQAPWRLGLSATPVTTGPGLALVGMTGDIIVNISAHELLERGVLVPPRIWILRVTDPKIHAKDHPTIYREGVVNNTKRNELIKNVCVTFKRDKKSTLVLVRRVAHGDHLADLLNYFGVKAEFIRGSVEDKDRERYMKQLEDGELDCIVGMLEIFGEGADYPFLRAIVNATGTRGGGNRDEDDEAGGLTLQVLGRGLRKAPGKEYVDYVDVADFTHKSLTQASLDRVKTLESEGYSPFIKYWHDYETEGVF